MMRGNPPHIPEIVALSSPAARCAVWGEVGVIRAFLAKVAVTVPGVKLAHEQVLGVVHESSRLGSLCISV